MATIYAFGRDPEQVADHYVGSRRVSDIPISTGQAVRAIRAVLPDCALTDRQLSDLVAASAIRAHRNVVFEAI